MHRIILFSIFTAFVLVSNVVGHEYHFSFYVQFNCSHPNFGVNAQFFDKDTMVLNGDDPITKQYIDRSTSGKMNFKVVGMQTGDEWLSNFFDVKMVLTHTCNRNGEEMYADVDLMPLFEITTNSYDKFYRYYMDIDITNFKGRSTYKGLMYESKNK